MFLYIFFSKDLFFSNGLIWKSNGDLNEAVTGIALFLYVNVVYMEILFFNIKLGSHRFIDVLSICSCLTFSVCPNVRIPKLVELLECNFELL